MENETLSKLDHVFKKWEKNNISVQKKEEIIKGKEQWTSKFGNNPAPIPRLRKYRTPTQRQKLQHEGYKGFIPNLGIDISHDKVPVVNKCCYQCTPVSHTAWHAYSNQSINMVSSQAHRRFGFFRYYFSDVWVCSHLKVSKLPEIKSKVLNSETVMDVVSTYNNNGAAIAQSLYEKMYAQSWLWVARIAGWVLTKIFRLSTSGIIVQKKEIEILQQAVERKVPILYLPLHRSHLDYIILMWVLCLTDLPSPFVAAGDNLNIPIVGSFLRKVGAFYIRRKPGEDHDLYKAILGQYLIELLKAGCSVEFFLEGRRSRSGLINPTKVGLLSQVVSAVKDGVISDVLLCPLSITYSKVPEENLTLELKGAKKEPENVFSALWYCVTFPFKKNYGSINVCFSEPFSLSEYIEKNVSSIRKHDDTWMNAADMDLASVFRLSINLGDHVLFNSMATSIVSKTALLALLLLTDTTTVSQSDLEKRGHIWRSVMVATKKAATFEFTPGYLTEPLDMFQESLNVNNGEQLLISRFNDSKIDLLLHYYSAPVVISSLSISSICLSIPKMIHTTGNADDIVTIPKGTLMGRAQYICALLDNTMKSQPPCVPLDQELSFVLDSLYSLDILKAKQTSLSTTDQKRFDTAAALLGGTTDSDDKLIVNMDNLYKCIHIGSVLTPYIQVLWFVLGSVSSLPLPKDEFVQELCLLGEEDYELKLRTALCTSLTHVANCVDKLIEIGIIVSEEGTMLSISPAYDNTAKLFDTLDYITSYF